MAQQADVGQIVKMITDDVKALVQGEVELAKAELVPSAKKAGVGAGMFGAAGYFALNGVSLLFLAGALAFALLFGGKTLPIVLGFVCMAVVVFILAGILALVGKSSINKVKGPEQTIAEGKKSVESVKHAMTRANAQAKTQQLERKHFDQTSLERRPTSPAGSVGGEVDSAS